MASICVYSSSSDAVDPRLGLVARELGQAIARRGCGLIYGGADVGLMGKVAEGVKQEGGRVTGVIPRALQAFGLPQHSIDELIVSDGMRDRKAIMEDRGDAFIALPGGFGTLEELLEIITLKQLRYHEKPVVILNALGFYDPLLVVFDHILEQKLAKPSSRQLYHVAPDVADVMAYLDAYRPMESEAKWF
jgi:hypothetical protein